MKAILFNLKVYPISAILCVHELVPVNDSWIVSIELVSRVRLEWLIARKEEAEEKLNEILSHFEIIN